VGLDRGHGQPLAQALDVRSDMDRLDIAQFRQRLLLKYK
jgi:hypothetical protein